MSLYLSVKSFEENRGGWRPFGENLLKAGERGLSVHEFVEQIGEIDTPDKIVHLAAKLLELLEGDRNHFDEGWVRLRSACHLCKIDLDQYYEEKRMVSNDEIQALIQSVATLKKCATKAACLFKKDSPRHQFSSIDLDARQIYILKALNDSEVAKKVSTSVEPSFIPWESGMAKSPRIDGLSQWKHIR